MAGRPRRHPIQDTIKLLKEGDTVLLKRVRGSRLVPLPVFKLTKKAIFCVMRRNSEKLLFDRLTGRGIHNGYQIVACGEDDITKYRELVTRVRGEQQERFPDVESNEGALPIIEGLEAKAVEVARRVLLHFRAGQFHACKDIIDEASADHIAAQAALREAQDCHGVGKHLSILPLQLRVLNSLELHGIHHIDQLCGINRDYLLDHVSQFTEERVKETAEMLERLGFEHRLHVPIYRPCDPNERPIEELENADAPQFVSAA